MLQINKHTVFILIIAFNTRPCYILGTRLAMYVKTALREPPIIDSIKPPVIMKRPVFLSIIIICQQYLLACLFVFFNKDLPTSLSLVYCISINNPCMT